jgi:hypothetical protein
MEKQNQNTPTDSEVINGQVVEKTNVEGMNAVGEKAARIKIARVDSLVIYEVSEGELEIIERGSPNSTFLNFSIFLLSIFISFLIALITCSFNNNQKIFYIFLIVCLVSGILGVLLFIIWWRTRSDVDEVIKKIKDRIVE